MIKRRNRRKNDKKPTVSVVFDTSYLLKPVYFERIKKLFGTIYATIPKAVIDELATLHQERRSNKDLAVAREFLEEYSYSEDLIMDLKPTPEEGVNTQTSENVKTAPFIKWKTTDILGTMLTHTQKLVIQTALHLALKEPEKDETKPDMVFILATGKDNPIIKEVAKQRRENPDFVNIHCITKQLLEFEESRLKTEDPPRIAKFNWYITSFMAFIICAVAAYMLKSLWLVALTLVGPFAIVKIMGALHQKRTKRIQYEKILDSN